MALRGWKIYMLLGVSLAAAQPQMWTPTAAPVALPVLATAAIPEPLTTSTISAQPAPVPAAPQQQLVPDQQQQPLLPQPLVPPPQLLAQQFIPQQLSPQSVTPQQPTAQPLLPTQLVTEHLPIPTNQATAPIMPATAVPLPTPTATMPLVAAALTGAMPAEQTAPQVLQPSEPQALPTPAAEQTAPTAEAPVVPVLAAPTTPASAEGQQTPEPETPLQQAPGEATASEPAATEQKPTEPAAQTEQTTEEPAAPEQKTKEPAATEQKTKEPAATEQKTEEPAATEQKMEEPAATEQTKAEEPAAPAASEQQETPAPAATEQKPPTDAVPQQQAPPAQAPAPTTPEQQAPAKKAPAPAPVPAPAPTPAPAAKPAPTPAAGDAKKLAAPKPAPGLAGVCEPDMLTNGVFNRNEPKSMTNAYLALLMARYTYPTAFGILSSTNLTRQTYQELYRRKWTGLGAKRASIQFVDVENPLPSILVSQPEAHAVVFATNTDVFVSFRGITNVDEALGENAKYLAVNGTFSNTKVPVHGGFYRSFAAIWPGVATAMAKAIDQTDNPEDAQIFLTGHSMGAAHALMAAMRLVDIDKPVGGLYMFGAPKVGQQPFIDLFEASGLEGKTVHWWNELDMVPNMSPPLRATTPRYMALPETTTYRIWQGKCARATRATAMACPSGERRCRNNLNDHFAFTYIVKMQNCLLQKPDIASNKCLVETLMATV